MNRAAHKRPAAACRAQGPDDSSSPRAVAATPVPGSAAAAEPRPNQRRVDRLRRECDVEVGPVLLAGGFFAMLVLWSVLQGLPSPSTADRLTEPAHSPLSKTPDPPSGSRGS